MDIRVGLSTNDLLSRLHSSVTIGSAGPLLIEAEGQKVILESGRQLEVSALNGILLAPVLLKQDSTQLTVKAQKPGTPLSIQSLIRSHSNTDIKPSYLGRIELIAVGNSLRVVLVTSLETYVQGVLQSEIPPSYELEAIKAQAVAARTYGLHPRLSHAQEGFNVCDSYLHCQYFAGVTSSMSQSQAQAIQQTSGEILTAGGKPILALFSACAGGHTEDYQNCFSDPLSNQFPPAPISYLVGVAEGKLPANFPSEAALRTLWLARKPEVVDAWAAQFRWQARFPAGALEGQMHHIVKTLKDDPQFGPFIFAPDSGQFGHIDGFEVTRRGVSGVAMDMIIRTSAGNWRIEKELTIRSVFKNPELHFGHLRSARLFFDHKKDKLGLLSEVVVSGLGTGHGVGMQQTGAQGWAKQGRTYQEILGHYFKGSKVVRV